MMKKSLVVLAAMAASGGAMAQSSVTLFGVMDVGATYLKSSGAGHRTGLSSGGNAASRLGFRGTEDLGGGLSASFWLEGTVLADAGTGAGGGGLNFQRRSTVSLTNQYGELRLGRDYVPTWWNVAQLDPFGARGAGTSQAFNNFGYNAVYNSNSVGYILPTTLGGLYGQVQYAFGEKASTVANDKQGNALSGRLGWQSGPVNVAVAYTEFKQVLGASDVAPIALGRDLKVANIAATYNFGVIKPIIFYGSEKVDGNPVGNSQINSLLIGATAPVAGGLGELRATVSHYDVKDSANDFNKIALGYVHLLSKRTQLYASVGKLNNKGAGVRSIAVEGVATLAPTRAGGSSTAVDVGIRHSF